MRQQILAGLSLSLIAATSNAASFTPLGFFPGGQYTTIATDISVDGLTVVGTATTGLIGERAFVWTAATGIVPLVDAAGTAYRSRANAVSADGSVIVGLRSAVPNFFDAFRWTAATGMVSLGPLTEIEQDEAFGVSADGSVIVGTAGVPTGSTSTLLRHGFRWTSTDGMVEFADPAHPEYWTSITDVSADGSIIVGSVDNDAVRWTSTSSPLPIGPPGSNNSNVSAMSGTGAIIVGNSNVGGWILGPGGYAFPGIFPVDVSADGSIIATANSIWYQQSQSALLLTHILNFHGATGQAGWSSLNISAISADGRKVVGWGTNPQGNQQAFLADVTLVPVPAAVWLLGSALGVLGWMRRKAC